jgi:hypothetical protein
VCRYFRFLLGFFGALWKWDARAGVIVTLGAWVVE